MNDDLTHVHVSQNALVAFIELITCAGCTDIRVNQADLGWQVTYKTIFTREVKACDDESERPGIPDRVKKYPQFEMDSCEECNAIHSCIARYDMDRANWKCAKGHVFLSAPVKQHASCSPQEIAEADCDGDIKECGDACHAKSKQTSHN